MNCLRPPTRLGVGGFVGGPSRDRCAKRSHRPSRTPATILIPEPNLCALGPPPPPPAHNDDLIGETGVIWLGDANWRGVRGAVDGVLPAPASDADPCVRHLDAGRMLPTTVADANEGAPACALTR